MHDTTGNNNTGDGGGGARRTPTSPTANHGEDYSYVLIRKLPRNIIVIATPHSLLLLPLLCCSPAAHPPAPPAEREKGRRAAGSEQNARISAPAFAQRAQGKAQRHGERRTHVERLHREVVVRVDARVRCYRHSLLSCKGPSARRKTGFHDQPLSPLSFGQIWQGR